MGILEKKMGRSEAQESAPARKVQKKRVPQYQQDGRTHSRWKIIPVTLGLVIILAGFFIGAVNIPPLFYHEPQVLSTFTVQPNEAGVKNMLDYVKDHPNDDFDLDGLSNAEETAHSTSPQNPDTDGDGVSDYAEIHMFNTRPAEYDNQVESIVQGMLADRNLHVTAPYKIHDVVMWADDLSHRARGTVIPTLRGYRFCRFSGWAQFPEMYDPVSQTAVKGYAYQLVNGRHVPLEYREAENAWRITGEDEVVLYAEPLPTSWLLTVMQDTYYVLDAKLAEILSHVLPAAHSFVTLRKAVNEDLYGREIGATVTGKTMIPFDRNDMSRFGTSTVQYQDLTTVYASIKSGRPVTVSLQSPAYGEALALVYGFTEEGDLMLCDEAGNDLGLLDIIEMAAVLADNTGELRQREYFDFSGLGFDSREGDRIHFIIPDGAVIESVSP